MPFYDKLNTDKIERIEQQIIRMRDDAIELRVELSEYLGANRVGFQHNPPREKHRPQTLYELVSTLGTNAHHLICELSRLQSVIDSGAEPIDTKRTIEIMTEFGLPATEARKRAARNCPQPKPGCNPN